MKIISGGEFKTHGLVRSVTLFAEDFSSFSKDNNGNITFIISKSGMRYKVGDIIEFVCGTTNVFRKIHFFELKEKHIILHFARTTNAYMMLLPLSDFCDIKKAFNAFILDNKLVVQVTKGLSGTLSLPTSQEPFFKDKHNALYYADIKDEFHKDYLYIMDSKYSRISAEAIKVIGDFNEENTKAVMAIKKDKELIRTLMKEFEITNESFFKKYDVELMEKMNMEKEVMCSGDLILFDWRPAENLQARLGTSDDDEGRRELPPGVMSIGDIINENFKPEGI